MFHNSNFKIMESNIQITAINKEFRNGTKGYEVLVSGMDNKLNGSMNFTDPLKAMRYMFMLSKRLDLQINKIDLAALSLAYKRIKDAEAKLVADTQETIDEVSQECEEHAELAEAVEVKPLLTPMQKQYYDLKDKHPEALLLFRCGDFYETYNEDAQRAADTLGITLTKSSKTVDADGKPMAMAGFPYHALDAYLPKLIRAGYRVAICDQLQPSNELPKQEIVEEVSPAPKKRRSRKTANAQQELELEVAQ